MDFAALREFMEGYLHQDFVAIYGSLENAAMEFRRDADPIQAESVLSEWRQFLLVMEGKPLEEVQRALRSQLGSAWHPTSLADLDRLTKALETAAPGEGQ